MAMQRPMSDLPPTLLHRPVSASNREFVKPNVRPSSEVLNGAYKSPEAEEIDRWFEDLSYYERTLEQMAKARLDDHFREELKAIEQWFSVLTDPERTTALYSLLQHTTPVQIRFFMTVLQQLAQKDPMVAGPPGTQPLGASSSPTVHNAAPAIALSDRVISENEEMMRLQRAPQPRSVGRLYDRHSAPGAEEQYSQLLDMRSVPEEYNYSAPHSNMSSSPLLRPKTPADDVIASVNWSVSPSMPPGHPANRPHFSPLVSAPRLPMESDGMAGTEAMMSALHFGSPQPTAYSRPTSPFNHDLAAAQLQHPQSHQRMRPEQISTFNPLHPAKGWGHVEMAGTKSHGYATSDYSDSYDDESVDTTTTATTANAATPVGSRPKPGSRGGSSSESHKEKGKIPESIDLEALNHIPSWLRSLRLHKYTPMLENMNWRDMIKMTDEDLIAKGVAALGARRKMLKVFELVNKELELKGIPH